MKTLLIATLLTLGFSTAAMAQSWSSETSRRVCDYPWQGYVLGACLDLYPELKARLLYQPRIIYRTRYVPVYIHHHHRHRHRHRHWW